MITKQKRIQPMRKQPMDKPHGSFSIRTSKTTKEKMWARTGNTNWRGRLSTVYLLIDKNVNTVCNIKRS
jgi:hypothetical protein